jgi:hypothetical protein
MKDNYVNKYDLNLIAVDSNEIIKSILHTAYCILHTVNAFPKIYIRAIAQTDPIKQHIFRPFCSRKGLKIDIKCTINTTRQLT